MRTAAKDIRFPDAGYATIRPSSWVEMRGGHYTSFAVSNMRYAPAAAGFRTLGGTRPGLAALTGEPETITTEPWMFSASTMLDWPVGEPIVCRDITRRLEIGAATLEEKSGTPVPIAGAKAPPAYQCSCLWRGRHVCADGALVYFSEIGNATNWDVDADSDFTAAPAVLNVALAGRGPQAQTVTALIPFRDKHLFIATQDSLHILYGDPQSGKLEIADDRIGILSTDAWAFDGETVWFLSSDGLFRRAGYGERHERISEELAPGYLRDIDPAANRIGMAYCPWEQGVYLDITPNDPTKEGIHVFIDRKTGYLWPDRYATRSLEPVGHALATFSDAAVHPRAAFKCRDGVWRVHLSKQTTDSGSTILASILLGPMRVAGDIAESSFTTEIECSFASQDDAVRMALAAADTPEALLPDADDDQHVERRSYTYPAPANGKPRRHAVWRPRARGSWATVEVSGTRPFSFDLLRLTAKSTGRIRP